MLRLWFFSGFGKLFPEFWEAWNLGIMDASQTYSRLLRLLGCPSVWHPS